MTGDARQIGVAVLAVGVGALAYTYVVYPLLVRLLPARPARLRRSATPAVASVVIAARNAGSIVTRKVSEMLRDGAREIRDVVVVLDGPDAVARQGLESLASERLIVCELPHPVGKAAALNAGVARARGDILVMTDARQRVAPGAIARLCDVLASDDVGAVSAALSIRSSGRRSLLDWYWQGERALRAAEANWDSAIGVTGALYALRRDQWSDLRPGLILDDLAVAMNVVRTGRRVAFAEDAVVEDVPLGSDRLEFARKVRTLTGNFQYLAWNGWVLNPFANRLWWQFVSHKVLRLFTPLATALVIVGFILARGELLVPALIAAAIATALALTSRLPLGPLSTLGRFGRSAAMLHAALVVAAANAVRSRWDVWSDPARPTFGADA